MYSNPNRDNDLMESIHRNTICHSRVSLCEYLLNPYVLNIRTSIVTNHLSLMRLPSEQEERLETIYNLHLEGKSSKEITHWMNEKYGTTLRTKKPYDMKLVWTTLDKYKKRLKRLNDYQIKLEEVELEKVY